MRKFVISSLLVALSFSALSQQEDSLFIRRISDEIFSNSQAYENLRELTKKIGGRLAGSPQMVKAELWGVKTMNKSGADSAWLQSCMVPHWVRGGKDEAQVIQPGKVARSLNVLALGNSQGTGPKPVSARVVLVKSFDDLEAKKDSVRGNIVFYNYPFNPKFITPFQAYGDAVRYRGQGASRAARYGAVAVIVRSMSHSVDNHPHTGAMNYDTAYPKIPAVAIGLRDADWLAAQLMQSAVTVRLRTGGKFLPDTIGHNVIGELRGSEFPDEYITVGGHLDSWDPAEGAQDDGAGCVQSIEILRAFRALGFKPRHSIRFVLFANEENGLRGGTKYAEEAKARNEKHIFALESDAGGFTPRGFGFNMSAEKVAAIQSWARLLAPYGGADLVQGGDGADIGPLQRAYGIPAAGLNPDNQRYFDYHHAANDVLENVNKRELELGTINMAALLYLVDKYGL